MRILQANKQQRNTSGKERKRKREGKGNRQRKQKKQSARRLTIRMILTRDLEKGREGCLVSVYERTDTIGDLGCEGRRTPGVGEINGEEDEEEGGCVSWNLVKLSSSSKKNHTRRLERRLLPTATRGGGGGLKQRRRAKKSEAEGGRKVKAGLFMLTC